MKLAHASAMELAKRAAGWSKGLSSPSYGLLACDGEVLSYAVRGPVGWLSDSLGIEEGESFQVGAIPSNFVDELHRVVGRREIGVTFESKDGRDRLAFEADGYRRACLMDPASGFMPDVSMPLPEVDFDAAVSRVEINSMYLAELLQLALLAAPSGEINPARAVVTLRFEDETGAALATDGFLLLSARTELEKPSEGEVEIHLTTEAAQKLLGLTSSITGSETVCLEVVPVGQENYLAVSFDLTPALALIPLPEIAGMPVARLLEGTKHRQSLATVAITPRTAADLTACGLEKSITLEGDGKMLTAWSRIDFDSAGEDAHTSVSIEAKEVFEGECTVDSAILGKLIKALKNNEVELQIAAGKESPGLLVIEDAAESAVSVLAGVVLQNVGG